MTTNDRDILKHQWVYLDTLHEAMRAAEEAAPVLGIRGSLPTVFDCRNGKFTYALDGWQCFLALMHGWSMAVNYTPRGWFYGREYWEAIHETPA